jgi:hypothetical protein
LRVVSVKMPRRCAATISRTVAAKAIIGWSVIRAMRLGAVFMCVSPMAMVAARRANGLTPRLAIMVTCSTSSPPAARIRTSLKRSLRLGDF